MDIQIQSRNVELNPEAHDYIRKKFDRLQRHLRRMSDAKIEVSRTSARSQADKIIVQMTVTAGGSTLRGQESGVNLFAAVDAVADVLDRQIRRLKGRVYRSAQARKAAGRAASEADVALAADDLDFADDEDVELYEELGRVVRTKRFAMKPMSVEDAAMQMELLSHDFFLFYNNTNGEYNVVYRRSDGDYGVIEPELA
jgi:putative sigma-54 modulation protein